MPIHSLKKLLGHQHLNTTQIYARIYDETLIQQFREAMARLEALGHEERADDSKHNWLPIKREAIGI